MTQNENDSAAPSERRFVVQKIYLKDVSFETPHSPHVFQGKWEPEINVQLGNQAVALDDGVHEVCISVTVTAKLGDKTAYLCEVNQAGIFSIEGFSQQELGPLIGSYCPNLLFPYVREAISELVTKGGFPQMLLQPVNFDAIYAQHVQKLQEERRRGEQTDSEEKSDVH